MFVCCAKDRAEAHGGVRYFFIVVAFGLMSCEATHPPSVPTPIIPAAVSAISSQAAAPPELPRPTAPSGKILALTWSSCGRYVAYLRSGGHSQIELIAARIGGGSELLRAPMPRLSDAPFFDRLGRIHAFEESEPNNPVEVVYELPSGAVVSRKQCGTYCITPMQSQDTKGWQAWIEPYNVVVTPNQDPESRNRVWVANPPADASQVDLPNRMSRNREVTAMGLWDNSLLIESRPRDASSFYWDLALFDLSGRLPLRTIPEWIGSGGSHASWQNKLLAVVQGPESPIVLYELPSLRKQRELSFPGSHRVKRSDIDPIRDRNSCLAFDPSGRIVAMASVRGPIRWFDVQTGKVLGVQPVEEIDSSARWQDCSLTFNSDGTRLVYSGNVGFVAVFDVASNQRLLVRDLACPRPGHRRGHAVGNMEWTTRSALSPNAQYFLLVGYCNASREEPISSLAHLLNLETNSMATLGASKSPQSFSPDSTHLVAGDRVWATDPLREISTLP